MATLAIQTIDLDGVVDTLVSAAGGGDKAPTGPGLYLEVMNGSGGSIDVTLVTPETVDGDLTVADRTVAVGAGARVKIALSNRYKNPSDGLASITYSGVTSLTVGVFRAPVTG